MKGTAASSDRPHASHLDSVVEHLRGGFLLEDRDRKILRVNAHFCSLFGIELEPHALHGMSCAQAAEAAASQFADPEGFLALVQRCLQEERPRQDCLTMADGRVLDMEYVPVRGPDGASEGHLWFYRDVTQAHRQQDILAAMTDAHRRFLASDDIRQICNDLLNVLLTLTRSEFGFMGEVKTDETGAPWLKTHAITNIAWDAASREFYESRREDGFEFRNLETLFGRVLTSAEPIISAQPSTDPRRGGLPSGHPALHAFAGIPIRVRGEMVGMVGLANAPGGYDAAGLAFLEPFLATIGQLIQAWRSERARQAAEAALAAAKEEAERATEAQRRFVASASHDMRTPLNAVLGLTALALESATDADQVDLLQGALRNGGHLTRLLSSVLDLARIDSESFRVDIETVGISELLAATTDAARLLRSGRPVEVESEVTHRTPRAVLADGSRIRQILDNLLSNAVRFTERGRVTLVVDWHPTGSGDDLGELILRVRDTGVGIPQQSLARIFDAFYRVPSTAESPTGVGLGLSIVRRILDAVGGSIEVASEPGQGSTFTVRLPAQAAPLAPEGESVDWTPTDPATIRGRLLVVDDHADSLTVAARMLGAAGFQVDTARSGEVALQRLRQTAYEAAVFDIDMPEMDGLDLLRALRQFEGLAGVRPTPVVALTAHATPELAAEVERSSMSACLTKPTDRGRLIRAISAAIEPAPHVLLVDDAGDSRRLIVRLLRRYPKPLRISEAASLEKARAQLRTDRPDLVLLDRGLPDGPGEALLETAMEEGLGVRFCFVSGSPAEALPAHLRAAADYLRKPLSEAELHRWVDQVSDEGSDGVDASLADLVPSYLEDRARDTEALRAAVAAADWSAVRRIAHTIVGTAGSYGFGAIERCGRNLHAAALLRDLEAATGAVAALEVALTRLGPHGAR